MSDKQKNISPIWLLSFALLLSATTCHTEPIKYTRQAVQFSGVSEPFFIDNDSIKADLHLVIWPKYIRPKREIIISLFLKYGTTRQFITRDTTRYHHSMMTKKTEKRIKINAPLEVRLSNGPGLLTYSLKYINIKTGSYREIFEPYNWPETQSSAIPVIAEIFADSVSYLKHKQLKPLHP